MLQTPEAVANTIRMSRTHFTGSFLIMEGDTDARLFRRLIDESYCRVVVAGGKSNAISAATMLAGGDVGGVLTQGNRTSDE